jgi:hypothetical protein
VNVVYNTLFYDVMQYGYEYHSIVLTILRYILRLCEQKPYFQIRENNWTLNAEVNGGWSVNYDL